jgi:very-short-patch-repair endonuclease
VKIDGFWHTDAVAWWNDMRRDNALTVRGYRVLRFPAFAVRYHPGDVARQIQDALRAAVTAEQSLARRDITSGR